MKPKLRDNFLFSKSSILKYIQCPCSFYFQYCTEYGRLYRKIGVTQPHLELGTNLHSFYETYNQGVDIADVEEVLCLDEDYARNIMGFYSILNEFKMKRASESEAKYISKEHSFMGFIDAVYNLSDESIEVIMNKVNEGRKRLIKPADSPLAIVDYKTGKYHDYLKRKYEYELNLYVHLIESTTDKRIGYIGMMFTGVPYAFIKPVNRKNLEKDVADFEAQKQNVYNDIFPRKPSVLCGYCDFKGICDMYTDDVIEKATETYY